MAVVEGRILETAAWSLAGGLFKYHWSVDKVRGCVGFIDNGEEFRGCADQTESSKSCGVVYLACLGGRSSTVSGWEVNC